VAHFLANHTPGGMVTTDSSARILHYPGLLRQRSIGALTVAGHHDFVRLSAMTCRAQSERYVTKSYRVRISPPFGSMITAATSGNSARMQALRVFMAHVGVSKIQKEPRRERRPRALQFGSVPESTFHLSLLAAACQLVSARVYWRQMSDTGIHRIVGLTPRERLIGLVRQILGQPAASRPLPIDARLSDLGLSSIKMVNLMLALEVEFGIAIPQSEITPQNFESIASIETLVVKLNA
jgi:acyl carrier protein